MTGRLDSYVAGWQARARQVEEDLREREASARRLLPVLVEHLVRGYGVGRVVLIGSLAEGGFHARSDIDLAVEGLHGAALYRAGAELEALASPFHVDLIPIEDAWDTMHTKIEQVGVVLHAG